MPVREPEELETRTHGSHSFTRSVSFWKELDERIKKIDTWNDAVKELCLEFQQELEIMYGECSVFPYRYKNSRENEGCEKFKPRNYLAYEGLNIIVGTVNNIYFFGQYADIHETLNTIKKELNELRGEKNEDKGSN